MKNVKKVLALVLAVTMMFGVVSVCASAIDTTTASYKFTFKDTSGNVVDSAKAGDVVDLVVSLKTDGYSPIFEFIAFYDYVALTQISATGSSTADTVKANNAKKILGRFTENGELEVSDELLEHEANLPAGQYGCVMDWGYGAITVTLHKANMYPSSWGAAEKEQYKAIKFVYKTKLDASVMTVNTNNEFVDVVSFRFVANADTALDNTKFILSPDASKSYISIYPEDECLSTGQTLASIKVENLVVEYGSGGSTSQIATVANKDVQTQWSDKANGVLKLGFRGTIANYDHTTDLVTGSTTKLAKLAEVGVVFSKTDPTPTRAEIGTTCTDAPAYAIYSFTTGEYYFRAVVDNVPATGEGSTDTIYANAYIKYNEQYYEATNSVLQTTGATQYADKDMANKD